MLRRIKKIGLSIITILLLAQNSNAMEEIYPDENLEGLGYLNETFEDSIYEDYNYDGIDSLNNGDAELEDYFYLISDLDYYTNELLMFENAIQEEDYEVNGNCDETKDYCLIEVSNEEDLINQTKDYYIDYQKEDKKSDIKNKEELIKEIENLKEYVKSKKEEINNAIKEYTENNSDNISEEDLIELIKENNSYTIESAEEILEDDLEESTIDELYEDGDLIEEVIIKGNFGYKHLYDTSYGNSVVNTLPGCYNLINEYKDFLSEDNYNNLIKELDDLNQKIKNRKKYIDDKVSLYYSNNADKLIKKIEIFESPANEKVGEENWYFGYDFKKGEIINYSSLYFLKWKVNDEDENFQQKYNILKKETEETLKYIKDIEEIKDKYDKILILNKHLEEMNEEYKDYKLFLEINNEIEEYYKENIDLSNYDLEIYSEDSEEYKEQQNNFKEYYDKYENNEIENHLNKIKEYTKQIKIEKVRTKQLQKIEEYIEESKSNYILLKRLYSNKEMIEKIKEIKEYEETLKSYIEDDELKYLIERNLEDLNRYNDMMNNYLLYVINTINIYKNRLEFNKDKYEEDFYISAYNTFEKVNKEFKDELINWAINQMNQIIKDTSKYIKEEEYVYKIGLIEDVVEDTRYTNIYEYHHNEVKIPSKVIIKDKTFLLKYKEYKSKVKEIDSVIKEKTQDSYYNNYKDRLEDFKEKILEDGSDAISEYYFYSTMKDIQNKIATFPCVSLEKYRNIKILPFNEEQYEELNLLKENLIKLYNDLDEESILEDVENDNEKINKNDFRWIDNLLRISIKEKGYYEKAIEEDFENKEDILNQIEKNKEDMYKSLKEAYNYKLINVYKNIFISYMERYDYENIDSETFIFNEGEYYVKIKNEIENVWLLKDKEGLESYIEEQESNLGINLEKEIKDRLSYFEEYVNDTTMNELEEEIKQCNFYIKTLESEYTLDFIFEEEKIKELEGLIIKTKNILLTKIKEKQKDFPSEIDMELSLDSNNQLEGELLKIDNKNYFLKLEENYIEITIKSNNIYNLFNVKEEDYSIDDIVDKLNNDYKYSKVLVLEGFKKTLLSGANFGINEDGDLIITVDYLDRDKLLNGSLTINIVDLQSGEITNKVNITISSESIDDGLSNINLKGNINTDIKSFEEKYNINNPFVIKELEPIFYIRFDKITNETWEGGDKETRKHFIEYKYMLENNKLKVESSTECVKPTGNVYGGYIVEFERSCDFNNIQTIDFEISGSENKKLYIKNEKEKETIVNQTSFEGGLLITKPISQDSEELIKDLKKNNISTNNIDKMYSEIKRLKKEKTIEYNKKILLKDVLKFLNEEEIKQFKSTVKKFTTVETTEK